MPRIDELPENGLAENIKNIKINFEELKLKQITGGDNLLTYFGGTDYIVRAAGPYEVIEYRLTFTGNSGVRSYAQPSVFINAVGSPTGFEATEITPDPASEDEASVSYLFFIYNDAASLTYQLKFGYRTIEEGIITWTEI